MSTQVSSGSIVTLVLVLALTASRTVDAITCAEAAPSLLPCLKYLQGNEDTPPVSCCDGVKKVNDAAKTTGDRRTLCKCVVKVIGTMGIKEDRAEKLPATCHVHVPFPIRKDTNCNNVPLA